MTGAIFARGSCRALKWMALFGVVFALGTASALAQPGALTDTVVTVEAADSVDTGANATVTVTVEGELAAGKATFTATTVTVTVSAAGLAGDSTAADFTDQQTALADLDAMSPYNAVTPAEDGDYTILDDTSNTDQTTGLVEIVLGPNTNTTRSIDVSGSGTFQLLGRDADGDAENEALRLSVTAVTGSGRNAADDADVDATVTLRTDLTADGGAVMDDIVVNDPQMQEYVLSTPDPANEGDSIELTLTADPAHIQGSEMLTLQHDMAALVESFGIAVTTDATSDGTPVSGSAVTIGSGSAGSGSTTSATITIGTKDDDDNRVADMLTLTAYSGQVGAAMERAAQEIDLADLHMLPMVKAILVDATGTALNPQPAMVTEGMDYMLKLIVVDDEGMALTSRFAEDLMVTLTQTGMADPQDDYSLGSSMVTIASGAVESDPITLAVDLNDDLNNESLILMGVVNGDDTEYGPPQPGLNPMEVLSLTIMDATSTLIWVKDGAEAAINTAMMAAQDGDGKINRVDTIEIPKSELFEAATGYTVQIAMDTSDDAVATVYDGDEATTNDRVVGSIVVIPRDLGMATITLTGSASGPSSAVASRQVSVDVAEIMFDVTVELAPPGPPTNLDVEVGSEELNFTWNAPNTGGAPSGYELRLDAGDWQTTSADARNSRWGSLTNGVAYVFEIRAVNDAGKSDSESIKATPKAPTVDASQVVTVKSVSAATSVAESGGLEVTVTATVPAGTKGADGKVAPIASKQVMVSFPTDDASIAAGEDADPGELTPLGATNGAYTWEKIARTEKASEATYKFRVAVGQDLDAEDEKFQVQVQIDGAAKKSKVVTIDDAQEQKYVLSLPAAAKGAITEGKSEKLTLKADPERTIDIPVTLALEPNDPSRYTLSVANGMFGTTSLETTVSTKADSDRADDTLTVTAYTDRHGEFASLDITIKDANALPAVKATLVDDKGKALDPQPESVMEGETVKVMLTAVDKDGKAMKAAEKLTITLMPTGMADAADYRLSTQSIEIASGKDSSAAVDLMITEDQDIGDETLMFDAAVSGEAKNGTEKRSVAGVLSLMITDGTQKLVWAKTQEEVEAAVYAAKNAGAGDDMTFTAGEMIEVMGNALFSSAEGVTLSYTADSDMSDVASASVTGGTVMVTAVAEGMAHITITAHASMASGVKILDQTDPGMASIMFPVEVGLEALSITLTGPEDMNLVEGGMGAMVTATANRAVTEDVTVMLMRDRVMSSASDADFTAEAITIAADTMSGTTMVMAVEDDMMETMNNMPEELVLYGMTEGMAGEVMGEVKFYLWDAAVPALPIIAQLLLAAFLAIGGYRRYRRR